MSPILSVISIVIMSKVIISIVVASLNVIMLIAMAQISMSLFVVLIKSMLAEHFSIKSHFISKTFQPTYICPIGIAMKSLSSTFNTLSNKCLSLDVTLKGRAQCG